MFFHCARMSATADARGAGVFRAACAEAGGTARTMSRRAVARMSGGVRRWVLIARCGDVLRNIHDTLGELRALGNLLARAERLARADGAALSLPNGKDAVDQHRGDSRWILKWILEGRAIGDALRIEDHHIARETPRELPAIAEANARRTQRRHLPDGFT